MAKHGLSIPKLVEQIPDEISAYKFLEGLRWPDGPVCPHCQAAKVYFLTPKDGTNGRKTRTGSQSVRRVFKCAACRKQFSVLTGTVMHGTKISIRSWCFVLFEMCSSKNGVSAREIERKYDVTAESAWHMCHRIREGMKRDPLAGLLAGTVIADETWIGGKPGNMHKSVRHSRDFKRDDNKTIVFSLVHKETGEVRFRAILPDVRGDTLRAALVDQVDMANSVLHTDSAGQYVKPGWKFQDHQSVNHIMGEYVRGEVTSNHVEGYFSQLKRSIDGTHHAVSGHHLPRYLAEFDFRYSTRKMTDTERMGKLLGQVGGKRLTYEPMRRP